MKQPLRSMIYKADGCDLLAAGAAARLKHLSLLPAERGHHVVASSRRHAGLVKPGAPKGAAQRAEA